MLCDLFFHKFYYLRLHVDAWFCSLYCNFFYKSRGILIKGKVVFFGIPFIYKYPGSFISIGNNVEIRTFAISNFIGINRRTTISTHSNYARIEIGDNCGMSAAVIGAKESIRIGNFVLIGANVLITDFDWHSINALERNKSESSKSRPVVIGNNVFIGYSSTILKGVEIGENSVIGAKSVVTSKIPANVIAAGNPCKVIKHLN